MYEIQTYTLVGGWINTSSTEDKNGNVIPLVFRTYDEAQAELDDYLGEVQDQIDSGERDPNHGYDANEFRVIMSEQE